MESNRNVILLEELKEEDHKEENSESSQKSREKSNEYLSDQELLNTLNMYKPRIPSVLLNEIYEMVRGKNVTKEQLEKIVENVELAFKARITGIEGIVRKLDAIEKLLRRSSSVAKNPDYERGENDHSSFERNTEQIVSENGVRLEKISSDIKSVVVLLKWVEFLTEKVGVEELEKVLNYYVDVGWISEDVLLTVLRYARGVDGHGKKANYEPKPMTIRDHVVSLLFIEILRTGRFDKEMILDIEKEIYRIKKEVVNYGI